MHSVKLEVVTLKGVFGKFAFSGGVILVWCLSVGVLYNHEIEA